MSTCISTRMKLYCRCRVKMLLISLHLHVTSSDVLGVKTAEFVFHVKCCRKWKYWKCLAPTFSKLALKHSVSFLPALVRALACVSRPTPNYNVWCTSNCTYKCTTGDFYHEYQTSKTSMEPLKLTFNTHLETFWSYHSADELICRLSLHLLYYGSLCTLRDV